MTNMDLTYFDIDLADIWNYELQCYDKNGEDFKRYDDLYFYLQPFYVKVEDHHPFLDLETDEADNSSGIVEYHKDLLVRRKENILLSFFSWQGKLYRMLRPLVIKKVDVSPESYLKLFALKLSQYKDGIIYLNDFLSYHLSLSFNGHQREYFEFLNLVIRQYENMLTPSIIDSVRKTISNKKGLPQWTEPENVAFYHRNAHKMKAMLDGSEDIALLEEEYTESVREVSVETEDLLILPDFNKEIPEGYKVIKGKMNREQIYEFFSVLFKEKSHNNKPFLAQREVATIFQYGIAIPPKELPPNRVKLNYSLRFPKKTVDYIIHKFYTKFDHRNGVKLDIIRFMASYVEDYSRALKSGAALEAVACNIAGKMPKRMKIDFSKYPHLQPIG